MAIFFGRLSRPTSKLVVESIPQPCTRLLREKYVKKCQNVVFILSVASLVVVPASLFVSDPTSSFRNNELILSLLLKKERKLLE